MKVICLIWLKLMFLVVNERAPLLILNILKVLLGIQQSLALYTVRQTRRPIFGFFARICDVLIGWVITDEGSKPDILSRIAQTTVALTRLKPVWNDLSISLSSKIRLMRSLVTSIFLYAFGSWTFTAEHKRRIQAMEMRCYRKILRIPYKDHVTNEEVRAKVQQAIDYIFCWKRFRPKRTFSRWHQNTRCGLVHFSWWIRISRRRVRFHKQQHL